MPAFFKAMRVINLMGTMLVCGVSFAVVGAVVDCCVGYEREALFASAGLILGMLFALVFWKGKIMRMHPETLCDIRGRGVLDSCYFIKKNSGKWALRWRYYAPTTGTFAGSGRRGKKRRREW